MTTTITEELAAEPQGQTDSSSLAAWIALLAGLSAVVGALAAVFWSGVVDLPVYRIQSDGSAVIGEAGLSQVVSADVWFTITGALVGTGLGIVTWKWFRSWGWPVALLAIGSGLIAGLVCWRVGTAIGPGPFDVRISQAQAGDLVPISLDLQSWSALAVWAFAAITPVLLAASLGPDDDDPVPNTHRADTESDVGNNEGPIEVNDIGVAATQSP